jgi:hypothetical protein
MGYSRAVRFGPHIAAATTGVGEDAAQTGDALRHIDEALGQADDAYVSGPVDA